HLRLERNLSRNTLDSYRRDTDRYLAWLGKRSVTELNTGDVESFMASLAKGEGLAASTRARILAAVRNFHRFLTGEGLTEGGVAGAHRASRRRSAPPMCPRSWNPARTTTRPPSFTFATARCWRCCTPPARASASCWGWTWMMWTRPRNSSSFGVRARRSG